MVFFLFVWLVGCVLVVVVGWVIFVSVFVFLFCISGCVFLAQKAKNTQTFSLVVLFIPYFLLGAGGVRTMKAINLLINDKEKEKAHR